MLGILNEPEIIQLLKRNAVGRIGCSRDDRVYIVPVTYVYHDGSVIAHSKYGLKIEMMRNNPNVCFEVDEITTFNDWKSVIARGTYAEITIPEEKKRLMHAFIEGVTHVQRSESMQSEPAIKTLKGEPAANKDEFIVFRITLHEITGRFESNPFQMKM